MMKTCQHHTMLAYVLAGACLLVSCVSPAAPAPTVALPVATAVPPTATPAPPMATTVPMLKPGANIGQMVVNTGPAETDGPPLWAFCSPAFSAEPGVKTQSCTVPPLPELAVGHGWFTADEARRDSNWKAMKWELYIDDQRLDLDAFGAVDVDLPQKGLPGQDPNKEIITKLRTWDVLLSNVSLGTHTLRSVLHINQEIDDGFHVTQPGTYELVLNVTVEVPPTPAATPTKPPTATPTQAFTLATSAEEIVGTWHAGSYYIRFDKDGTFRQADALEKLENSPYAISAYHFEGTTMVITEVSVSGVPTCGKKTGSYEIRQLENGKIRIVAIKDQCAPRAGDVAGEYEPGR